ncbi:hypothetical protein E4T43_01851 [Aureobasidium subglaciale]|nr:hypothetical protein E4T43_01851 [Aureobasidium subglaciale]
MAGVIQETTSLVESPYLRSLLAGAVAGTTVDTSLYPLDTLKTRLQSSNGFLAAGGFRGVYAGVGSAIVGSAPGAALFFVTYDAIKRNFTNPAHTATQAAGVHMVAASLGEVAACAVRVPTEVVKQRAQAKQYPSSRAALASILVLRKSAGWGIMAKELYRGWGITVMREVPFTVIQFPLWEGMKRWAAKRDGRDTATALQSAVFGSITGGFAAALTTPLDVLKTRMMLAKEKVSASQLLGEIYKKEGMKAFFKGIEPRVTWISIGGAVFLGSYQWASNALGGVN